MNKRRIERLTLTRRNAADSERRQLNEVERKLQAGDALSAREAELVASSVQPRSVGRPELAAFFHQWMAVHYLYLRADRARSAGKVVAKAYGVTTKAVEKYAAKYRDEVKAKHLLAVLQDDERKTALKHLKMYADLFVELEITPESPFEVAERKRLEESAGEL